MFGAEADALLDVQEYEDNLWVFILEDRIKHFDPAQRKWLPDIEFSGLERLTSYHRPLGRGVAVGAGCIDP